MQENSAAATGHAGPRVVIDFDDQIVEAVGPRQAIAWFTGRPLERLVVAPIGWVFTPGVVRPDPPDRQQSARPRPAIGAPPQPNRMELPGRRRAIALAFGARRFDARAAQGGADDALPSDKPGLRAALRPRSNMDHRNGRLAHCLIVPVGHHESVQPNISMQPNFALTFCGHVIFSGIVFPFPDHALVSAIVLLAHSKSAPKRRGRAPSNAEYA